MAWLDAVRYGPVRQVGIGKAGQRKVWQVGLRSSRYGSIWCGGVC